MVDGATLRRYAFAAIPIGAFCSGLLPQDASNPWMMGPFVILSLYLILSGRLSQIPMHDPVFLLLLLLWLGWTWGGIFSAMPIASRVTLLMLGMLPVSYLVMYGRDVRSYLYLFTFGMAVTSIFAIAQVTVADIPKWRANLFLEDSNTLGCLFAIAVPVAVSYFFASPDTRMRNALYIAVALLAGGIIATQSRSALLAALTGTAFVLYKNRSAFSPRFLHYGLPILLLLVGGFFISTFGTRLLDMIEGDKDVMGRIALWRAAFDMLSINPWHGVGLGIFHLYYPQYKLAADNSAGFWVHMDPLQWAVETGWATAIVFYALCGYIFWRALKKDTTHDQIAASGALTAIFLCAHASYIFHYPPIMVLTGTLLTTFTVGGISAETRRYFVSLPLVIVLVANLWSVMVEVPTLYFWRKGIEAYGSGDVANYSKYMTQCIEKGDPGFPACRMQAADVMISGADDPPEQALVWLKEADRAIPLSADIMFAQARYHLKKYPDRPQLAEADLREALQRNPTAWNARALLIRLLMLQKRYDDARDVLKGADRFWIEGNVFKEYHDLKNQLDGAR